MISEDGLIIASAGQPLASLGNLRTLVTLPLFGGAQMTLRSDGQRLVFERRLSSTPWFVRYAVRPKELLRENATLLLGATLLLCLYAAGVFAGMRYMRQRIIEPARQRTKALLERDAFTQTLIETAPVGMAIIDPFEPAVVMSNPAYAGTVDLLRHLGDGELTRMYRQLHSGVVARPVRRLLSAMDDAGERHYAVSFVDTVFREQPVLIGTLSDVTEQRRFELEQRKARLAAESANRAKDVFLTTVSHEMRTPLYGTLASLELLSAQNLGDDHRYYVDVMESSTRNLLDLINDLLDYSRIQVGRFELNSRDGSLLKELEAVGLSFTGRARLQGLTLDWMIDPQLSRAVHTDALRLGQVVTNLVGNAIKFTEKGHVAFSAMITRADMQGCDVAFAVSDSGVGIAAADLADLFKPFGKSTTEPGMQHGTGLGLAISHQFVGMLGGVLQVDSKEGEGTTMRFTLRLPWAPDSEAPAVVAAGETFAYVSALPRRHWYLEALIRRAGYEPMQYSDAVTWSTGSGRSQDAGLLLFADEWPVRGMAGAQVYLLRATPVDRPAGSMRHGRRTLRCCNRRSLGGVGRGATSRTCGIRWRAGRRPCTDPRATAGGVVCAGRRRSSDQRHVALASTRRARRDGRLLPRSARSARCVRRGIAHARDHRREHAACIWPRAGDRDQVQGAACAGRGRHGGCDAAQRSRRQIAL